MSNAQQPTFGFPLDGMKLSENVQKFLLSKALSGESAQEVIATALERMARRAGFQHGTIRRDENPTESNQIANKS